MAALVSEFVWMVALLKNLGVDHTQPALLYCDNQTATHIAANPVFHKRTKHIELDCHFVREKIQDKLVKTFHVSTKHQLADLLTKLLGHQQFNNLLHKMGINNIYAPSWGGVLWDLKNWRSVDLGIEEMQCWRKLQVVDSLYLAKQPVVMMSMF